MSPKQHEALELPLAERVSYLTIVASMAGADVVLRPEETERLRALCQELELPERETAAVLGASQAATATIARDLEGLKSSPLRFALLSDCILLAYADGDYGKDEQREVHDLAGALDVDDQQLGAIEDYVRTMRAAARGEDGDHQKKGAEVASRLASVGIPVSIIAGVSAVGLNVAGVSSGLAALALGLGIASGFGAAVGLGIGTFVGVRWLQDKLAGKTG